MYHNTMVIIHYYDVHMLMQCVTDSSVSLDPNDPDAPIAAAVGKRSSTPKGAKPKGGRDSLQSSSLRDGEVSSSQPEPVAPVRKDVDALVSVTKYLGPALKGLSPKNQLKVDTAIMQQTALKGICTNICNMSFLMFFTLDPTSCLCATHAFS